MECNSKLGGVNMQRYEAVLGFNSKQWWAYDSLTDEYCDPPKRVLEEVDKYGGDWREDPDKAEAYFNELLSKEPDWLNDEGYRRPGETDI